MTAFTLVVVGEDYTFVLLTHADDGDIAEERLRTFVNDPANGIGTNEETKYILNSHPQNEDVVEIMRAYSG